MKTSTHYLIILLLLFAVETIAQEKVLVVSGGGARGAWGGGVVQHLVEKQGNDYSVVIGTSTGSLMAPLIAVKDFKKLRDMYTSVTQPSIFNVNPFKIKTEGENVTGFKLNGLKAVLRLILGKPTLGETKNLRKLIEDTYPPERYNEIVREGHFIITVANFTNSGAYYFSSKDLDDSNDSHRAIMLDHIWRSSNQPLFMTLDCSDQSELNVSSEDMDGREVKAGDCWVDAGIRENVPLLRGIQYILEEGDITADNTIDVIINNTSGINLKNFDKKKILPSILRTIDILTYDVRFNDVNVPGEILEDYVDQLTDSGALSRLSESQSSSATSYGDIIINFHFMPEDVFAKHPLDLYFATDSMKEIWNMGYDAKINTITESLSKQVAELMIGEAKTMDLLR